MPEGQQVVTEVLCSHFIEANAEEQTDRSMAVVTMCTLWDPRQGLAPLRCWTVHLLCVCVAGAWERLSSKVISGAWGGALAL